MNKSNDSDHFEIKISPEIVALWDTLGLVDDERDSEIEGLVIVIRNAYNALTEKLVNKCSETKEQIIQIQEKHHRLMVAYGLPEKEIKSSLVPIEEKNLLQQLADAQKSLDSFNLVIEERLQKFENFVRMSNSICDELGIPIEQRGEFREVGETDLTRSRIERFRERIDELNKLKEQRKADISSVRKRIDQILFDTHIDLSKNSVYIDQSITEEHFNQLKALENEMNEEKQKRVQKISELAVTITHLWDLLEVREEERQSFLRKYSALSNEAIAAVQKEVEILSIKREKKLPILIQAQYEELHQLWDYLHIAEESRQVFHPDPCDQSRSKEFEFLEKEIIRLKKLAVNLHPILELIHDRENIISEYELLRKETADPSRLTSRDHNSAQLLIREEKARRRYKVTLPRVEKKLKKLLIEYKAKHLVDFEWDGSPYVEKLANVVIDEPMKLKMKLPTNAQSVRVQQKNKGLPTNENTNPNQKYLSVRIY